MKEPTHISEIIESMDIFAKEPKPFTFKRLRTKKAVLFVVARQKTKFFKASLTRAKLT